MSNGILVFVEHRGGVFSKHSFEAIAAAQDLAGQLQQQVTAVVLGANNVALANEVAAYDVAKVVYANNAKLADYTPDGYTDAMEKVVRQLDPALVVMPHTYLVRDFAPKLAARFEKRSSATAFERKWRWPDHLHAPHLSRQARRRCGFRWRGAGVRHFSVGRLSCRSGGEGKRRAC